MTSNTCNESHCPSYTLQESGKHPYQKRNTGSQYLLLKATRQIIFKQEILISYLKNSDNFEESMIVWQLKLYLHDENLIPGRLQYQDLLHKTKFLILMPGDRYLNTLRGPIYAQEGYAW